MDKLSKSQETEREHFIDLLRGGGIAAVVLQHSLGGIGCYEHLSDFFLAFHMPLFFLCSGYLYKHSRDILEKRVFSLLVPSLLWRCMNFLISIILACLSLAQYAGKLRFGGFWFLNALFCIHIIHFLFFELLLNRLSSERHNAIILSILMFLVFTQILAWGGIIGNMPREDFLCQALVGYAFFVLGWFVKKNRLFERIGVHFFFRVLEGGVALCAFAILWFTCSLNRPVWMYINLYGNPCLFYFNAVLGCLGTFLLAHAIGHNSVFEFLGRYSLLILLQHFSLLCFFPFIWHKLNILPATYPWLSAPLILGITAMTSPIIQRHMPLLAGKKAVDRS